MIDFAKINLVLIMSYVLAGVTMIVAPVDACQICVPYPKTTIADALIKADKDFDLLVIPGAGHGAMGTRYGRRRMRDFFVRHLHGVEPRTP